VRQFAAESAEGYSLWLRTDAGVWTHPEQFEVLVSFVATLAEDLFRAGRLMGVAIDGAPPMAVRRVHDLELLLNQLAILQPSAEAIALAAAVPAVAGGPDEGARPFLVGKQHVMTFVPEGSRNVAATIDGQMAAST